MDRMNTSAYFINIWVVCKCTQLFAWILQKYSLMYKVIATVSQMHASGLQILATHSQPLLALDRKCLAHFPVPATLDNWSKLIYPGLRDTTEMHQLINIYPGHYSNPGLPRDCDPKCDRTGRKIWISSERRRDVWPEDVEGALLEGKLSPRSTVYFLNNFGSLL